MDEYDEKCLMYLVEKDPDISVLEFHVVKHMFDDMGLLFIFLNPYEFVNVFMGRKYVQDELNTKILDRSDLNE